MLRFVRNYTKYARNGQIYLHELGGVYKFSFSDRPEALGIGTSPLKNVSPANFQEETPFISLLHDQIRKKIHNDFSFIMEAGMNVNTFMPIYDFREIPKYARVPEIENIFGYVHVNDQGKIVEGSYEPNSMYRLCNGTSGLIKLSDYLHEEVQKELNA